jgi:hypothetical protein
VLLYADDVIRKLCSREMGIRKVTAGDTWRGKSKAGKGQCVLACAHANFELLIKYFVIYVFRQV